MTVRLLVLCLAVSLGVAADLPPASTNPDAIVENYLAASRTQQDRVRAASMDVDMEASLPNLKQHGRLHALRRISALGRITYEMLRFEGDNTVRNQVIARYLNAEAEAQQNPRSTALAVSPANYKFKYKGRGQADGRDVYMFQVTPRQKRSGLFQGEIWIDSSTYLRVRESGNLVKNPSFFLKRVAFVRNYEIRDGISEPRQVQSIVETRLVGKAELTIHFSNFIVDTTAAADADIQ